MNDVERGCIESDSVYTLDTFRRITGLKSAGIRAARRDGLRVAYCHNRAFIRGQDWHDYVSSQSTEPPGPPQGQTPPHLRSTHD